MAHRRPLILGHRGASRDAPENTLAAFCLALDQGADGVELDVTLSADGVPVVIHDDTLDRTTNGSGLVGGQSLAALRALDAGYPAQFGRRYARERMPTLAETFEALLTRAPIINVELKVDRSPGRRLAGQVAAVIAAHAAASKVLVSSFRLSNLRRMQRRLPAVRLGWLHESPGGGRAFEQRLGCALRLAAHHPQHAALARSHVDWYHAQGYEVFAWTVNDPAEVRRLADLGVDGLITDAPALALASLQTPG